MSVQGGSVSLAGGDVTGGTIDVASAALMTGFGTLSGSLQNSGTIIASGGDLAIGSAVPAQARRPLPRLLPSN